MKLFVHCLFAALLCLGISSMVRVQDAPPLAAPVYTPTPPADRKMGIAYGLWHQSPNWGTNSWGMPTLETYASNNRAVIRKHAAQIADAGVEFYPAGLVKRHRLHLRPYEKTARILQNPSPNRTHRLSGLEKARFAFVVFAAVLPAPRLYICELEPYRAIMEAGQVPLAGSPVAPHNSIDFSTLCQSGIDILNPVGTKYRLSFASLLITRFFLYLRKTHHEF